MMCVKSFREGRKAGRGSVWITLATILGIMMIPPACAANAVDMFNPTYIELLKHVPACTTDNPFGSDCNAAIHRWCGGGGYVSGFGPVEHYGVDAWAVCVSDQNAGVNVADLFCSPGTPEINYISLSSLHPGCTPDNPVGSDCNAAIHRWCRARGYASGFGPVEHYAVDACAVCVSGSAAARYDVPFSGALDDLSDYHSGCSANSAFSDSCNAAINRFCQDKGAVSGFGPVEHDGTNATVACVFASAVLPAPSSEHSVDADGILWGTESAVGIDDFGNLRGNIRASVAAVNGILKTNYVKFRLALSSLTPAETGGYSSKVCLPGWTRIGWECNDSFDLDETVKLFKQNGWSMVPMLTHDTEKNMDDPAEIKRYVDFVDWFLSKYQFDAAIQYVELINAPVIGDVWKGTIDQLIKLQNATYERIKAKFLWILVGTPGFEYFDDADSTGSVDIIEDFLDPVKGAKFDFWAFHGYPLSRPKCICNDINKDGVCESVEMSSCTLPPTSKATLNTYAGIPGILEVRQKLDTNGWSDRIVIDTEHTAAFSGAFFDDDLITALHLQEWVIKRTLSNNGAFALDGLIPLKMHPRGETGEFSMGSLFSDGSPTKHANALGLLMEKLNAYRHAGHVNGAFDDASQVWVEKFESTATHKELYIFFKPFKSNSNASITMDNETLNYDLSLPEVEVLPASIILTDADGKTTSLPPSLTITLQAENTPKFLEVDYCGNGICTTEEGYVKCQADCPSQSCGDGVCAPANGENETTCGPDCRPPELAAIGPKTVNEGQTLNFAVSATDPNGDSLTYSISSAAGLPAGAGFSGQTFTWTPGYSQAGNYDVTFTVSDGVFSDSETVTMTVVDVPPDLVMTAVSGPASAVTGTVVVIANTVKDQSAAPAGSFSVGVYFSADSVITTADTRIATRSLSSLSGGASSSANTSVTLPTNLAAGPYYLGAIADYAGKVAESNETNNALTSQTITVTAGPDLVMTAVSGPGGALRGAAVIISHTIKNQGVGKATNSSSVGLYLSKDSVITTADTRVGTRSLSSLASGASSPASTSVTIPATLSVGAYYIGALADYINTVRESSETNNALAGNIMVVQ